MLRRHRYATPLVAIAFGALAIAAAIDDGASLRAVDEPVTRALVDLRSGRSTGW